MIPEVLIEYILSYKDPLVTQKQRVVFNQLNYYYREFCYLKKTPANFYSNWDEHDIIYFIFNRCNDKTQARGTICPCEQCEIERLREKLSKLNALKSWKKNKKRENCRKTAYGKAPWSLHPERF